MPNGVNLNALRGGELVDTQKSEQKYYVEMENSTPKQQYYRENVITTSLFTYDDGTKETTTSDVNNPDKIKRREFTFPDGKEVSDSDFGKKQTGVVMFTSDGQPIDVYKKGGTTTEVSRNSDGTASKVKIDYEN